MPSSEQDGLVSKKLPRTAEVEEVRKQFCARLDAPKIKTIPTDIIGVISTNDSNTTSLRDSMSNEQIAALKAKRLARKRCTIIDADTDLEGAPGTLG